MATDTDRPYCGWPGDEISAEPNGFEVDSVSQVLDHGSISFGRFSVESLSWERRSVFSHNRCQEELERCSAPGLVAQKKAYFEEYYKKIRTLKALQLTALTSDDGSDADPHSQTCENGESNVPPENVERHDVVDLYKEVTFEVLPKQEPRYSENSSRMLDEIIPFNGQTEMEKCFSDDNENESHFGWPRHEDIQINTEGVLVDDPQMDYPKISDNLSITTLSTIDSNKAEHCDHVDGAWINNANSSLHPIVTDCASPVTVPIEVGHLIESSGCSSTERVDTISQRNKDIIPVCKITPEHKLKNSVDSVRNSQRLNHSAHPKNILSRNAVKMNSTIKTGASRSQNGHKLPIHSGATKSMDCFNLVKLTSSNATSHKKASDALCRTSKGHSYENTSAHSSLAGSRKKAMSLAKTKEVSNGHLSAKVSNKAAALGSRRSVPSFQIALKEGTAKMNSGSASLNNRRTRSDIAKPPRMDKGQTVQEGHDVDNRSSKLPVPGLSQSSQRIDKEDKLKQRKKDKSLLRGTKASATGASSPLLSSCRDAYLRREPKVTSVQPVDRSSNGSKTRRAAPGWR